MRYAADFVILHHDLGVIEQANAIVAAWLTGMGLALKPRKTRLVHTLQEHADQPPGFDFLGFTVRQFPVGKTQAAQARGSTQPPRGHGYKTITKPSKAAVQRHELQLKQVIRRNSAASQEQLIAALNPLVAGWANYYRTSAARTTFVKLDHRLFLKLRPWAAKRHRNHSPRWVVSRYWHPERGPWRFATPDGKVWLNKHAKTRIQRHSVVKADRSPYDGDWSYWATRLGRQPLLPVRVARLLKQQGGRCQSCGLLFTLDERGEVDHIVPRAQGGPDRYANLQLLQRQCHDQKTARDHSLGAGVLVQN